jgi:DMSO reductase family type II enzyme chaperone
MGAVAAFLHLDRACVYRGLAGLFRPPDPQGLDELRARGLPELRAALGRLGADAELLGAARAVATRLDETESGRVESGYEQTFEASGGLRCPPNETPHTQDTGEKALLRTYELADVAGFYRAFGVEVTPGSERPDHIAAELEFMHLLAVKEAVAEDEEAAAEHAAICRDATRAFLRDHLGNFAPRLAERLAETAADPLYADAGRLLSRFVAFDMASRGAG